MTQRKGVVQKCNLHDVLEYGDIEDPSVSHLIMQYNRIPTSGERSFETREFEFVSEAVKKDVMERVMKLTLEE